MANKRKSAGTLLNELAEATDMTQTEISKQMDVPVSQINRYFRGHNDIYASQLIRICKILEIDIERLIKNKIQEHEGFHVSNVETIDDCVQFLFGTLDNIGKQTYLKSLHWAARVSGSVPIPKQIVDLIQKNSSLI